MIYAAVRDPMLNFPKIEIPRPGHDQCKCVGCSATVEYSKKSVVYEVIGIACSYECSDSLNIPIPHYVAKPVLDKDLDIDTEVDAPELESSKVEVSKPISCPECNGQKMGRGYSHTDNCSLSTKGKTMQSLSDKTEKEKCSACGGERRGRGFAHKGNCPESTAFKLAKLKETSISPDKMGEKCSVCGGQRKGRGFSHTAGCSQSTAARLASSGLKQ